MSVQDQATNPHSASFHLGVEISTSSMPGIREKMPRLRGRGGGDNCDIPASREVVVVFMLQKPQ